MNAFIKKQLYSKYFNTFFVYFIFITLYIILLINMDYGFLTLNEGLNQDLNSLNLDPNKEELIVNPKVEIKPVELKTIIGLVIIVGCIGVMFTAVVCGALGYIPIY